MNRMTLQGRVAERLSREVVAEEPAGWIHREVLKSDEECAGDFLEAESPQREFRGVVTRNKAKKNVVLRRRQVGSRRISGEIFCATIRMRGR